MASIIPPLPESEVAEGPILLTAVTVALMLDPHVNENGACVKLTLGTVQVRAALIVESEPSQLAVRVLKELSTA